MRAVNQTMYRVLLMCGVVTFTACGGGTTASSDRDGSMDTGAISPVDASGLVDAAADVEFNDSPSDVKASADSGWCSPTYGPVPADEADATAATPCSTLCLGIPTMTGLPSDASTSDAGTEPFVIYECSLNY